MASFRESLQESPLRLDYATLLIAKEVAFSHLNVEKNLQLLDDFARTIELRLRPTDTRHDELRRISEFLFDEMGFHGNSDNYYAPHNSFLNKVLELRMGIPITLSIVYIAVGKRLGLPLYGVGLPGHFIVGCSSPNAPIYLDPFHDGLLLDANECKQLAMNHLPEGMAFSARFLDPQPPNLILMRILNNLRHIYITQHDLPQLLSVLRLQKTLNPRNPELNRDIGVLCTHLEHWGEAVRELRYYVYARPQGSDIEKIRAMLHEAVGNMSKLN